LQVSGKKDHFEDTLELKASKLDLVRFKELFLYGGENK